MRILERVMRITTQVNMGAAIDMVAWVAASGYQVMSGALKVPHVRPVAPSQGEPARDVPPPHSTDLPAPWRTDGNGRLQVSDT